MYSLIITGAGWENVQQKCTEPMINIGSLIIIFFMRFAINSDNSSITAIQESQYLVKRLQQPMTLDANWNKPQWEAMLPLKLENIVGEIPVFIPEVNAKMMYDDENIYVIFKVADRFIRSVTREINGPVWEDSCVEFFFAPDTAFPLKYYNLEINCGGTPLMHYNLIPRKDFKKLDYEHINKIEIAHSLPKTVDPEILEPVTWTIEYRIPIDILRKYSNVTLPKPGIIWRANFYKIADKTSNPHYLSWSVIKNAKPDFHLPQYFGDIKFE